MSPVAAIERSLLIRVPPQEVARVLLDADLAPRWTSGLERFEVVSGRPGEAGCVGHAHYREGRRSYVLVDVLEDVVPNRYYRSHIEGGGINVDVETRLDPVDEDGTRLTLRWFGTGTNSFTRISLPLMKHRIATRADADLRALRDLAEGPATH
jgi:uncharacterized protein YndB with AHSA1/START domain